ncbi:hypothetical protein LA284_000098 [Vibrio vulnificus]|nr:hypothetical protein [Vibrio vulnificus]EID0715101.1 hypothetical protein [Vibrio vulnificus]EID0739274.1 hypothetical protein [Vibrio vulnificus]EJL7816774.1 hypothetical protein [Vibrio vulnificus]
MNKELEQAKALREEAREALALAREFNEKSKERQEETTELLKKCRELVGRNNNPPDSVKSRDVFDIVHAINVLAMANTDVLHVFTYFMAHTNEVMVFVNPSNTVYEEGHKEERLLNEGVYLGKDDTLEKLLAIESQLTELIIEAREAAETKAPEQAEVKA